MKSLEVRFGEYFKKLYMREGGREGREREGEREREREREREKEKERES